MRSVCVDSIAAPRDTATAQCERTLFVQCAAGADVTHRGDMLNVTSEVTWPDNVTGSDAVTAAAAAAAAAASSTGRWEGGQVADDEDGWTVVVTAAMGALAACVTLATVGGNLVVLLSFFLQSSLRQPSNYFTIARTSCQPVSRLVLEASVQVDRLE